MSASTASKTYYSQDALHGFATALGVKLGLDFKLATGKPCTNGDTIYLPPIKGALTRDEFSVYCGMAIHEAAHCYYGTPARLSAFAGTGPDSRLRGLCMNAACDVADESRIEDVVPSARNLLTRMSRSLETDAIAAGAFGKDPVWAVLCAGIFWIRLGASPSYRLLRAKPRHPLFPQMMQAYKILKTCRHRRKSSSGPNRSPVQWARIERAAEDLFKLLSPLGDGAGAPDPSSQFGALAMPDASGAGTGSGQPGPGDTVAGAAEGQDAVEMAPGAPAAPGTPAQGKDAAEPVQAVPVGMMGGTGPGSGTRRTNMNEPMYRMLRMSLRGAVERLARHEDADGFEDGHVSGCGIGRNIERAMIGGDCFVRRNAEGEALHACVLLDNSGSMCGRLQEASAVAQAFAESMTAIAQSCSLATFDDVVRPVANFANVRDGGGTETEKAIEWADKVLSKQRGRRVCVVITDGEAYDVHKCRAATEQIRSHGVSVIGIAYRTPAESIAASMPGAHVVQANDPAELSLHLTRIAEQVAASR